MRASAISCRAPSKRSSRVAATRIEHHVQIWDVKTRAVVSEFETLFSFGGHRLTLDPLGERCIAAAWKAGKRGGVACYETNTGKLIWHRQDLRQTQRVRFSPRGEAAWCVPDSGATKLLDAANGKTPDALTPVPVPAPPNARTTHRQSSAPWPFPPTRFAAARDPSSPRDPPTPCVEFAAPAPPR